MLVEVSQSHQMGERVAEVIEGYALLALRMEVNPTHAPNTLVKADIVEPLKARPRNRAHPMVRDEKVLLPAHEDVLALP